MPRKKKKNNGVDYSVLLTGNNKSIDEKVQSFGVILEHIDSKMDRVMEYSLSVEEKITKRIDSLENKMNQKFELVEAAIINHSKEIKLLRDAVTENKEATKDNRKAIEENRKAIEENRKAIEENRKAIERLENKFDKIEDRQRKTEDRLDEHCRAQI